MQKIDAEFKRSFAQKFTVDSSISFVQKFSSVLVVCLYLCKKIMLELPVSFCAKRTLEFSVEFLHKTNARNPNGCLHKMIASIPFPFCEIRHKFDPLLISRIPEAFHLCLQNHQANSIGVFLLFFVIRDITNSNSWYHEMTVVILNNYFK